MNRLFSTAPVVLGVALFLFTACNCPPRPEPSTSGGGNTYGKSRRGTRNVDEGWNPPPRSPAAGEVRVLRLPLTPGALTKDVRFPIVGSKLPDAGVAAEGRPPFVPRGAVVLGGESGGSDAPVRVQLGPRPVVLEAGRLFDGDGLVLVVTEAETEEVVYEREFTLVRTAARAAQQPDLTVSPDDWNPEPGRYILEILRDGLIVGVEELTVPEE